MRNEYEQWDEVETYKFVYKVNTRIQVDGQTRYLDDEDTLSITTQYGITEAFKLVVDYIKKRYNNDLCYIDYIHFIRAYVATEEQRARFSTSEKRKNTTKLKSSNVNKRGRVAGENSRH